MRIFTIGHSNQPLAPFVEALDAHGVRLVADVRRKPFSRRHPHFSQARLSDALRAAGIAYLHLPELGGHREPRADSRNTAIRDAVFRGYADHMETDAFAAGIARLLAAAAARPAAIMCAERKWSDCHRQFIADCLAAAGHDVIHILAADAAEPHALSRFAQVRNGVVSYAGLL